MAKAVPGQICPDCKVGTIVERFSTKYEHEFLGCTEYNYDDRDKGCQGSWTMDGIPYKLIYQNRRLPKSKSPQYAHKPPYESSFPILTIIFALLIGFVILSFVFGMLGIIF